MISDITTLLSAAVIGTLAAVVYTLRYLVMLDRKMDSILEHFYIPKNRI